MEKRVSVFILLGLLILFSVNSSFAEDKKLIGARFPEISPDGSQIAFSYLGDIWLVPSEGGKASRLTDHSAYDREPVWSPDGNWIAFTSNRFGNNDVFIMLATGGEPLQLTFHTSSDLVTDFTPDGKWIIFQSSRSSSSSIFKTLV